MSAAPLFFLWWVAAAKKQAAAVNRTRTLEQGPPSEPPQPLPPAGYRRARSSDVTPDMVAAARSALVHPIGTLLKRNGWAIQLEWHFHPPGGTAHPWGWHKGATVYLRA
jgi:hypothetical protein